MLISTAKRVSRAGRGAAGLRSPIAAALLLITLVGLLAACQAATPAPPTGLPADGHIRIDPGSVHQVLDGFGASGAWWAQDVGGWEEVREQIAALLFDPQAGIGLSIYRYNIGGGENRLIMDPWRKAETFEVAQGEYDWSRDANAIWMLKAARAAGVKHFVAFANSPPARMTISGRTNADYSVENQTNLAPEMYPQFAQYLVDVVRHLRQDEGIPIGWLSPINEPQWDWQLSSGQEGSYYTPAQAAALTREVVAALAASGLDLKVSVFEGGEWSKSSSDYVGPLLADPELKPFIDHLAIHSYWSTPQDKAEFKAYLEANYAGMPVEMTEWTEMNPGRDVSMDSALLLANTVHDDLTIGEVIRSGWLMTSYPK